MIVLPVFPFKWKRMKYWMCCFVILSINCVKYGSGIESDLTVVISPGQRECFHQFVPKNSGFEVEYQVIEGGDLDIDFFILSPTGHMLLSETRRTDGVHKIETKEDGSYQMCFDNSFSRFSNKLTFFEIITNDPDPTWEKINNIEDVAAEEDQTHYEFKLDTFKEGLDKIKIQLEKSRQTQNILRIFESRDRSMQEHNYERVNFWSGVQLFIMISVGLMQVLMIRSLFADNASSKGLKVTT